MPDEILPLLRGRITGQDWFRSPRRGPDAAPPYQRAEPIQHAESLRAQLDALLAMAKERPAESRDPEATRELVAFRPAEGEHLPTGSLTHRRGDVQLVSSDPESGVVIVDSPSPELNYLRGKLQRWVEEPVVGKERKHAALIAPLERVDPVGAEDRAGPLARETLPTRSDVRWWEIECRGGARVDTAATENTRRQMSRAFERLGVTSTHQYLATERLVYFARTSLEALLTLVESTDCVFKFDLAPPDVRGWLMVNDANFPVRELGAFAWTPPAQDAPAVVLLDSGTVSGHPMLRDALLSSHSALPQDPSPEDTIGHGTRMAGVALFEDVAEAAELGHGVGTHWLQSVKVIVDDAQGTASEENREFWPEITQNAVESAEGLGDRRRVYSLAITAPLPDPRVPTWWSHAVDRIAFAEGRGRVLCVSIGNMDPINAELAEGYPQFHLDHHLEDPAHAVNALTVGAYTTRTTLPPDPDYAGHRCVAPAGGVAPCTRAGLLGAEGHAIKPDVVFEGGNFADGGGLIQSDIETLQSVSTGPNFLASPLVTHRETSLATAHAARFAARVWAVDPSLRPETVRGLVVHSAAWTPQMIEQLRNRDERLALCGYGVPDLALASGCQTDRATVIVEDRMPSAVGVVDDQGKTVRRRIAKYFTLPIPEGLLQDAERIWIRVTLAYFAEPNTYGRRQVLGLDLAWDMQGPNESAAEFRQRINLLLREPGYKDRKTRGYEGWKIGPQRRNRGTVQSDWWQGAGAFLHEPKQIAVHPRLGWWERRGLTDLEMPFSLIVTVRASNDIDVYTPLEVALRVPVEIEID